MLFDKLSLPIADQALPGRDVPIELENKHFVNGRPIKAPFSSDDSKLETILLGLGCFWGAERKFWNTQGVYTTAVGYGAGFTPNPTYEEVCTGGTGHNELVLVVYEPQILSINTILKTFFEAHNPTQGMRQGNDKGTQYRSGIYYTSVEQKEAAQQMLESYEASLSEAGLGGITTEVLSAPTFYYAEQYHQQYLAKNPNGYCGIGGTGISCAI